MLRDHLSTVTKYPCEILTVDPEQKMVQGIMRAGPVHISVYSTDPFFRWPIVGENWVIRQENGTWYLDSILQSEHDAIKLEDIEPGDMHLNVSGKIHTNMGYTVTRKFTQKVGDASETKWVIVHNLNDMAVSVNVLKVSSPHTALALSSWKVLDANSVEITFSSAPELNDVEVVIIG